MSTTTNTTPEPTPEMSALKAQLKATWTSGDYGRFARFLEGGALDFLERLALPPGTRLLDVACGAGQIAIPAARAGVRVTGIDIAPRQIAQARERAREENLDVRFDEGDAEAMPYPDASFDVVVSLIGAMFAPRPDRVASELRRVCRPGGRIVMANWTPEGFVGRMLRTVGRHVPPSPLMPSPLLWGTEAAVRERFGDGVTDLRLTRRPYPFAYPFGPADVAEFYRAWYGPVHRAFEVLDAAGGAALRADLEELWAHENVATDGTTRYESEYLEVSAMRA